MTRMLAHISSRGQEFMQEKWWCPIVYLTAVKIGKSISCHRILISLCGEGIPHLLEAKTPEVLYVPGGELGDAMMA